MGAVCGCGTDKGDIASFWRGMELRKITFQAYCKIFEKNQMNWLSSGDGNNHINLRKCEELSKLLYNPDFTEAERKLFIDKLNEFVNSQSDKLIFFTCLSFFTKLNEDEKPQQSKKIGKKSYIESLRNSERSKNFDIVFDELLNMAIKKNEHEDVTKLFIALATVFPLPFLYSDKKEKEENFSVYSYQHREQLFNQIKMYNKQKFYEYMFNKENVSIIHNDLVKIHFGSQSSRMMSEVNVMADFTAMKKFTLI
jgi:hypothetical protein